MPASRIWLRPSEAAAKVMNMVDLRTIVLHPDGGADRQGLSANKAYAGREINIPGLRSAVAGTGLVAALHKR